MKNEVLIRRTQSHPSFKPSSSTFFTIGGNLIFWGRNTYVNAVGQYKFTDADSRTTVRVIEENDLSQSIREALYSLSEIARLKDNWDGYGAIAPPEKVIKESEGFIRRLNILQQDVYFVSPGPNGNLLVELRNGERTIGFHFHPEKPLRFVCFEGKDFVRQGIYEPPVLNELLDWLYN